MGVWEGRGGEGLQGSNAPSKHLESDPVYTNSFLFGYFFRDGYLVFTELSSLLYCTVFVFERISFLKVMFQICLKKKKFEYLLQEMKEIEIEDYSIFFSQQI